MIPKTANNDADLVNATLAGSRDAFTQIVSRYQSLICSLAYSATGSLGQSEDLAQETFITAWRHLSHLRERDKLRSWLCGIARNRINNFLRREGREPVREAEPLENAVESHSAEPLPVEYTITKEEEAILWRSLEKIPETYREPLVLFYREHQSVEAVAEELELTVDTVHQRLSRGRKLLQEQVLAFVEGALARTNPGRAFTLGVLAALPALTFSAKAATLGAAAAKGGAGVKAAGTIGFLGAILSPLMILCGNFIPYLIGLAEAKTDDERRQIKSFFHKIWAWSFGLSLAVVGGLWLAFRNSYQGPVTLFDLFMIWFVSFCVIYLLLMFGIALTSTGSRREYYAKILAEEHGGVIPEPAFEYCSRAKFLGLPLVHVRIGDRFDVLRKPVTGWIVLANYSVGGLVAFGGVAIAPFSIGGIAIGLLPLGGLVAGLFPLGAFSLGGWADGGIAIGWQAIGACAIAWHAATGYFALAHDFATGDIARGLQANTDAARQAVESNWYFLAAGVVWRYWFWVNFLWITPLLIKLRLIARKSKKQLNLKTRSL